MERTELVTFKSKHSSYVWAPLPPASSYGHRAELWGVDSDGSWLREVATSLVEQGDGAGASIRLHDEEGRLFASAPLPSDSSIPLTTVVEPVVDSSRYFVVRVEDEMSGKHAFVGLGFRERADASDFTAGLDDWRRFLLRKKQAEEMRMSSQAPGTDPSSSTSSTPQYALSEEEQIKISIKIPGGKGAGLLSRPVSLLGISPPAANPSSRSIDPSTAEDDWGEFVTG